MSHREHLGPLVAQLARAWRNRLDQRLRPLGLSQAKWLALLHLSKAGDGIPQKALAEALGIEGPSLVGLLDRMVADGWVERRESPRDRRCKHVHLTEKALGVTRQINGVAAELRSELLAGLSDDDIETCFRVLQHIKQQAEEI